MEIFYSDCNENKLSLTDCKHSKTRLMQGMTSITVNGQNDAINGMSIQTRITKK